MGNPTVTPIVEAFRDGGFLVSTPNGHRHIDQGTLTGTKGLAGMILGALVAGTSATATAGASNTGNGAMGAITTNTVATQVGTYDVTFTAATAFTVTAPDGDTSTGTTGVAFSALGIGFTITAGGTAFVAGDGFTITTVDGTAKPTATAAAKTNTGNGTCSAVTCTGYAPQVGLYKLVITAGVTNAGGFEVEGPDGRLVGSGQVGTAFVGGGLSFTLADGATDFVAGDRFDIKVAANAGAGKFKQWNPSAVDGTQTVAGILFGSADATAADKQVAVVARACEVNASELVWPTGANAATIAAGVAGLKTLGILAR